MGLHLQPHDLALMTHHKNPLFCFPFWESNYTIRSWKTIPNQLGHLCVQNRKGETLYCCNYHWNNTTSYLKTIAFQIIQYQQFVTSFATHLNIHAILSPHGNTSLLWLLLAAGNGCFYFSHEYALLNRAFPFQFNIIPRCFLRTHI